METFQILDLEELNGVEGGLTETQCVALFSLGGAAIGGFATGSVGGLALGATAGGILGGLMCADLLK